MVTLATYPNKNKQCKVIYPLGLYVLVTDVRLEMIMLEKGHCREH